MSYAPLDFFTNGFGEPPQGLAQEITFRPGHMWEDCYPVILQGIFGMSKQESETIKENELLTYVLRRNFLIKNHNMKKEHAKWDKNLLEHIPVMISELGYKASDLSDFEYIVSEIRDMTIEFLILDKWVRNKQVLKPDPVFTKYLCETERLQVSEDTFDNLPFNTFYLDLEDCNENGAYGDALGIFVNVMRMKEDNETALTLYVLRPGNILVSLYLNFDMNECPHEIDMTTIENNLKIETVPIIVEKEKAPAATTVNPRLMTILILQIINYIKTSKPDIMPSPEMKSTYRPKNTIKNKYSEIYKQDVGIRVGNMISSKIKEMNVAKEKQEREAVIKGRKPPVPHFRRAHWQRFWTGKGRTVCELKWIEPVFVCGSYRSDSVTDVVIHNVRD